MRIILSGGGTIGSVTPLIAIYQEIKSRQPDTEFLWLATKNGPEIKLVSSYQIPVRAISAGKFRRYFSFRNFFDPFSVIVGFFQSLFIIAKFKPQAILSAGGFVSVPVIWAGWLSKRPCLIHQQDVLAGLANKLMAPFANIITVTFEKSLNDFPAKKTKWVGNPVRQDILAGSKEEGYNYFKLDPGLPTILVMGGGTGAANLNQLIFGGLQDLVQFCQVIHLTGGRIEKEAVHSRYHSYEFLTDQLKNAYAAADLVVSRAGLASLTEIAVLRKPAIIIPMFSSHQEKNAMEFFRHNAIALLNEKDLNSQNLVAAIRQLLADKAEQINLSKNLALMMPTDASQKIADMIL
jgi:UDP-N-acetylglucosamine--N-acetylmuramyl-(pentapeptide) pyrophosphoryl-undecaprenol N-acetylglucosamine transferase